MDLFGYEELLVELARSGLKIQLNVLQKRLFSVGMLGDLFEFDEPAHIKVYARFYKQTPFTQQNYEKLVIIRLRN